LIEVVEPKLWVEDLARELKSDHEEIRRQEWILKLLVYRGEYTFALQRAAELQALLGQHFLKEESGLQFGILRKENPPKVDSAERQKVALDGLIQRHKEMRNSFEELMKLTALSTEREKLQAFDTFESRFLSLLKDEESEVGAEPSLQHVVME
jgi:hypothetical protein